MQVFSSLFVAFSIKIVIYLFNYLIIRDIFLFRFKIQVITYKTNGYFDLLKLQKTQELRIS